MAAKALKALLAASLATLLLAPAAKAVPSLGVGIERFTAVPAAGFSVAPGPAGPISHSDYEYFYSVKVKNTGANSATCYVGTWTGTPAPTFAFQWLRDGVPIAGSTSKEYSPVPADQNHSLQCLVTATNAGGGAAHAATPFFYGQPAGTPPAPSNPTVNWRPTVTTVGETTTRQCNPPTNWNGGPAWTFQWLRNGAPIAGATEQQYTPVNPGVDQNTVLQCLVNATTATGAAVAVSGNVGIGSPASPPENTFGNFFGELFNPTTNGAEWTSGTTNLSLDLPAGLVLKAGTGSGWSCALGAGNCASTAAIAPGAEFPTLTLNVGIQASAPDTVIATAIASGGGAGEAAAVDAFELAPAPPFEMLNLKTEALDEAGAEITQAGSHPFSGAAFFELPRNSTHFVVQDLREVWGDLPVGFVGNPLSVPVECPIAVFEEGQGSCPPESVAGGVRLRLGLDRELTPLVNASQPDNATNAVYRLKAPKGFPAAFGFTESAIPFIFRAKVRTDSDYGITIIAPRTSQVRGVGPVSGAHFAFCGYGANLKRSNGTSVTEAQFGGCLKRDDPEARSQPLMTVGTKCAGAPPRSAFAMDSWQHPGSHASNGFPDKTDPNWKLDHFDSPPTTGCEQLTAEWLGENEPSLSLQPDTHQADSPAGYTAKLHIPQDGLTEVDGLATSHLRNVSVTMGEGISLNPAVGDGIDVCSMAQMGALTEVGEIPPHFDMELPHCPDGSKIGNARIDTPLLENPLRGSIYLAPQQDNPFGTDYAIYLVVEEPDTGIVVKLAGKVTPDQKTGQIHTTFVENPELPFEDLKLDFFGGGRAAIANPPVCGTFETSNEFTPWSAEDPFNPRPDEVAKPSDQVSIDQGPNGAPCVNDVAKRPFELGLTAGSKDPVAGAKSPFSIRITRPDGNQEISKLEISPPPGFVASLKGIPYCSDAQIAAAASNAGKAEQKSSSCPLASEVGQTISAAGAGPTPFYAPGKLYLAGPYKGQTLSVVAITPAVAGPFDLGNVVIRSALKLNSRTARITAITDEIPQIINGIPLRIKDVRIDLDRPGWAQTPTNCEALSVDMTAYGSNGGVSKPSNRYQVGGCENLGFKPKLEIHLKGGTKRGDHPALVATLSTRDGDANIARAAVTLPPSAFLDQAHIRTVCTRVQFAADACPKGAIYGYGKAVTELLDDPIEGNVYLRSSDNKLPDLVAALKGVANIEAVGKIDSVKGGIRNTFDIIPDAPFDAFTLKMQGGKKGLVVNSQNLCAKAHRATVKLTGQNGKRYNFRPKVIADGCKKAKKGKRRPQRG